MKQRNDTNKLVDAFFHVAFQKTEAYQDEVERYEAIADEQGGVSPELQKAGIRKIRTHRRGNVIKRAGAIAAVLVVCFGMLIAAPAVIGFEWTDIFTGNGLFSNREQSITWGDYALQYVPDGFVQTDVRHRLMLEYNGQQIYFWYTAQDGQGRLSGEDLQEFDLHGRKALLMTEQIDGQTWNIILYYFGSDLLTLQGNIPSDELMKIAENIEKIK